MDKAYTFYLDADKDQRYQLTTTELKSRFRNWIQDNARTKAGVSWLLLHNGGLRTLLLIEQFIVTGLRSSYDLEEEADLFYFLARIKRDEFKKLMP